MATQRATFDHHASTVTNEIAEAGIAAGLVGGLAMAVVGVLYSGAVGHPFWLPVRAIAETVLGGQTSGPLAPILGVVIHLVVSMMLGVVFAMATPRDVKPLPAFVFGEFTGLALMVIMTLFVLPVVSPVTRSHLMWGSDVSATPVSVAFIMHMVYGAGLSLAPWFRRRFSAA